MKVRRLFSQSVSLILTCCLLFELLPSTVAATVAEVADSFENAVNENLEMEAIPFSGENSVLETKQTVVDSEESEHQDYSKNAAFKTSGLTLDVFKTASKLHGGDNAFSRELAALNSGVVDDSLSKTDATNIRQLICSGYTYRQARAAIVSIETLEVTIEDLCVAKEAELAAEDEETSVDANLFLSVKETSLTDSEVTPEVHNVAIKLGVPDSIISTYMDTNKLNSDSLLSEVTENIQAKYESVKAEVTTTDAVAAPATSSISTASTTSSEIQYAPEQVLDNPYDYKNYGNLNVNLASGSYKYTETDLYIPGINGLDLNITRIFDSAFSYAQCPAGHYDEDYADDVTLRVSFDIYVSYTGNTYTVVSDLSDYEDVEPEMLDLLELSYDFTSAEHEDAVSYRTALALLEGVNDTIWGGYDADGELVYIRLHPTIKAIGNFESSFDNTTWTYDYHVNEFGLGHGWRLGFSAIENYRVEQTGEKKNRLILSDGTVYALTNSYAIISDFDNLELTNTDSEIDYAGAEYKLTYADGKREYFDANGRNIAVMDRYGNTITIEYEYEDAATQKVVTQIKITDTLGNIVIYKKENLTLGEDGYLTISGLSSSRSRHDSKWTLSFNGTTIRSYYSYRDSDSATAPRVLKLVQDEDSNYTIIATSTVTNDYNCYVMVPTTNDGTIKYADLNYITYPNGLTLDKQANSSVVDRQFLGDGGYKETLHFGGTVTIAELDSGDVKKEYTKLEIGDSSGYYVIPEEDLEYCSTETIYRVAPYGIAGSVIWKSKITEHYFDAEHHLVEEIVYAHGTVQEHMYDASTSSDRALLGTAFRTTYTYGSSPLPTLKTLWTYEPGNSTDYTSASYRYKYDDKGNVTEETLPNGNVINYTYSPAYNILLSKTYNQDADTVIVEQNTLTSDNKAIAQTVVTSNGMTVAKNTYTYDALGRTTQINTYASASDYTTQAFAYGSSAQPTQISVSAVIDADGEAATATPNNTAGTIVEKTAYNGRGWPTSYTDGNGNVTALTYDAVGRITQVTYPNGGTDKYEYDVEVGTVKYTDPNNNTVTYQYDYFGNLTSITDNISGSALVTYDYDSLNNRNLEIIHSSVDGNDQSTYYYYDNLGRIIETGIRNADGSDTVLESYVYSAGLGKTTHTVIGSTNAPSQINTSYVDKMGSTVKTGRMYSNTEYVDNYTYDYLGNCTKYISAYMASLGSSYSTQYTYDHAGNVLTETDALGNVKTYTYDWTGNLIQSKDAKNSISTNTYDKLGRLIQTATPIDSSGNNVVKYYYDGAGNVTKQLTSTGTAQTNGIPTNYDTTEYVYDNMNRLTEVDMTVSPTIKDFTTYTYDLAGNITQMAAGGRKNGTSITVNPVTTTYTYDRFGNVLSETDALNKTKSYTYDLNGAILTRTDRNNVQTQYAYDNRGCLTTETIGTGSSQLVHAYTYALNNALLSESQGGSTITYTYDALGRLTQEYTSPFYKNYTYNIGDLCTGFNLKKSNTVQINSTYAYDVLGRLTSVTDSSSGVSASYTYDANSNPVSAVFASGVTETYSYNSGNLVTAVGAAKGGTPLTQFQYTYDLAGRQSGMTTLSGDVATYTYDTKGQLINDMRTGNQSYSETYTYDPRGNRVSLTDSGTATAYTYNTANQLLNSTKSSITTAYTYDGNGNTLTETAGSSGAATYTYDVDNQLTGISGEDLTASYTYYPNGLRKTKTVDGVTTTYAWDGDQLVYEANTTALKYIRGLSLIASVLGSTATYYLHDAHGNVVALTNASGTVTRTYEYDAFGNQLNINPADTNPFRYCGEYYDAETGSYYLRARYYNSALGRFTQQDTYRGDTKIPLSLNYYTYCYNNPVRYVDRNGNLPIETAADVASAISSVKNLIEDPSWGNLGYLAIDAVALAAPYIPASYAAKGIGKIDDIVDTGKSLDKIDDTVDGIKSVDDISVFRHSKPSSKKLRSNMIAAGKLVPDYPNDAHHIVASNHPKAKVSKDILANFKIDINSAANGVFLPRQRGTSMATFHPGLSNSTDYYIKVQELLETANSREDAIRVLDYIASELQKGTFLN